MKFIITINEMDEDGNEIPRYSQTVDRVDIHAVINAVNDTPDAKGQRQRALRSDAGKPRATRIAAAQEDLTVSTWPGKVS